MLHLQNVKHVLFAPRSVATNATASDTVDCQGFSHALVICNAGLASSNMTVLKLASGTASNSFTDIAAATGGSGFTIPSADTDNGVAVGFSVDLRKRERFLKCHAENTSAAHIIGWEVILTRAAVAPDTDAERGLDEYVSI